GNCEWIQRLLELNSNRIKYKRQTKNLFVSEQLQYLQLLPQHARLPNNYDKTNKQSSLLTVNGIEPDINEKVYVPLILAPIKYKGALLMTCVLGFNCKENVEWLRGYINNTYSNLFEHAKKLFNAKKKYITMINSAKHKARKLESSEDIQAGLPIKAEGWNTSSSVTQALGIQLQEVRNELKNTKKKLHRSLETIQKLNADDENNENSNLSSTNTIQSMVNNLIKNGKLGSTIFVNTDIYLTLILNQPCPICYTAEITNKKPSITVNGLGIKIIIKCLNCKAITEHSNESPEIDFSTSIAAAGLVGGQDKLFDGLKNEAVNSAQKALHKVLDKLIENKQFNLE
ncbi:714_t:CDS:2, partial [Dentiscutata heterogama]